MDILLLSCLFFIIAFLYSMIGFGGGSSYIALLFLMQTPIKMIPAIALICNLIVVSGGLFRQIKERSAYWRFAMPFLVFSIPMAFTGGLIPVSEGILKLLVACFLILSGILIFLKKGIKNKPSQKTSFLFSSFTGGFTGLIAGLTGIGGGIYLTPILHLSGRGKVREIVFTSILFIFVNSVFGLAGQIAKSGITGLMPYWSLFAAVLIGGQLGSFLNSKKLPLPAITMLTAGLVLFAGTRMLFLAI